MRTQTVIGSVCLLFVLLLTSPTSATSAYAQGQADLTASTGWFPGWGPGNSQFNFQFQFHVWQLSVQTYECYRGETCSAWINIDLEDGVQVSGQLEINGKIQDLPSAVVQVGRISKAFGDLTSALYIETDTMKIDGPAVLLTTHIRWPDDADTDGEVGVRFKVNDDAPLNSAITITIPMVVSVTLGFADGSWEKDFRIPAEPIYQTYPLHIYKTQAEKMQDLYSQVIVVAALLLALVVFIVIFVIVLRHSKQRQASSSATEPAKRTLFCAECGAANSSTNKFCDKCGARLIHVL